MNKYYGVGSRSKGKILMFFSSDSEPEKSPTPSSMPYSQSCDIEQHRPISRENSDVIARQPTGEEKDAVVNEELVHRSMELSQRLSPEAIS